VDGHTSQIALGFGQNVSRQFKAAKDVKRSKRKRKEKPEMKKKRKKKKAAGGEGGSKISDLLHHTKWNRTKISGVVFMEQGRRICAHSSAECVAISA
jgi:hypothetical protein